MFKEIKFSYFNEYIKLTNYRIFNLKITFTILKLQLQ
jgi:hypothetical protein